MELDEIVRRKGFEVKIEKMSKTIDLPDEIYARLVEQAKARGLTVPQLIAQFEQEVERACLALALERLQARGLLAPQEAGAITSFRLILVQGQPLSDMIKEERR